MQLQDENGNNMYHSHQSLSVSIHFLSPNACDWSIRQIHNHDWLRVKAGIQNVPKQNFQDSNKICLFLHENENKVG